MEKQDIKNRIVLLHDSSKTEEKKVLTEEEKKIKDKLLEIEAKIDSLENVLNAVSEEKVDTVFCDKIFGSVVSTIAITAATNVIAEYFNVSKEDLENSR